jgi:hypothetical protein
MEHENFLEAIENKSFEAKKKLFLNLLRLVDMKGGVDRVFNVAQWQNIRLIT